MKKKLVKWTLTITALAVLPFVQGCADDDDDNFLARTAFTPVTTMGAFGVPIMGGPGANGSQGPGAGGPGSGINIGSVGTGGQVGTGGVAF